MPAATTAKPAAVTTANVGFLLAKEGNIAEAKTHFEETLRYAPLFDKAHFNLATLLKSQGHSTEAARHYARFIELWADADEELQPRVRAARSRLDEILRQRG